MFLLSLRLSRSALAFIFLLAASAILALLSILESWLCAPARRFREFYLKRLSLGIDKNRL